MGTTDPLHEKLNEVGEHFAVHVQTRDAERRRPGAACRGHRRRHGRPGSSPGRDQLPPVPRGPVAGRAGAAHRRPVDADRHPPAGRRGVQGALEAVATRDASRQRAARSTGSPISTGAGGPSCCACSPSPAGAAGHLDPSWIDVAAEWVFGDQRPEATVRLRVLGVERAVRAAEAAGVLHGCAAAQVWCDIVTGDVGARVRTASISFGAAPHVAIAGGGPTLRRRRPARPLRAAARGGAGAGRRLRLRVPRLRGVLRRPRHGAVATPSGRSRAGRRRTRSPDGLGDRYVPRCSPTSSSDPVTSPGCAPPTRIAAGDGRVGGDRCEVLVGAPVDWLPTSEVRADVRGDGWELLEPILLRGRGPGRGAAHGRLATRTTTSRSYHGRAPTPARRRSTGSPSSTPS